MKLSFKFSAKPSCSGQPFFRANPGTHQVCEIDPLDAVEDKVVGLFICNGVIIKHQLQPIVLFCFGKVLSSYPKEDFSPVS